MKKDNLKIKIFFLTIVCLTFFGMAENSEAAEYYADGNLVSDCISGNYSIGSRDCTGGDGNAYNTVQEAVSVATVAGDAVLVRSGMYTERVSSVASGNPGNPITLASYEGEAVSISSNGDTHITLTIRHNNIVIDGLHFSGTGSGQYYPMVQIGLVGTRATGIIVKNCHFTGVDYDSYGMSVYTDGGIFEDNEFVGSPHMFVCIHVQGDNNIVRNNSVHDIEDVERVFDICSGNGILIQNNNVYNMTRSGDHGAHLDVVQYVGSACQAHVGGIIENNYFHDSPELQITMVEPFDNTGAKCEGWFFRNNIISRTAAMWIGCEGWHVVNNTFHNCAGTDNGSLNDQHAVIYSGTASNQADNLTIKNNLFIGCGDTSNTVGWYGIYDAGAPVSGLDADYNYVTKAAASGYGSKSSFSEIHGIGDGGNPMFVSEGTDYALQSLSLAKDSGTDLSGAWSLAKDRTGIVRPQGSAWDIGAFEFVSGGDTSAPAAPQGLSVQ